MKFWEPAVFSLTFGRSLLNITANILNSILKVVVWPLFIITFTDSPFPKNDLSPQVLKLGLKLA